MGKKPSAPNAEGHEDLELCPLRGPTFWGEDGAFGCAGWGAAYASLGHWPVSPANFIPWLPSGRLEERR